MCLIEFAERASYYGSIGTSSSVADHVKPIQELNSPGPFRNFVNRPLPPGGNGAGAVAPGDAGLQQTAGALGKGPVIATAVVEMFRFLVRRVPFMWRWVSSLLTEVVYESYASC